MKENGARHVGVLPKSRMNDAARWLIGWLTAPNKGSHPPTGLADRIFVSNAESARVAAVIFIHVVLGQESLRGGKELVRGSPVYNQLWPSALPLLPVRCPFQRPLGSECTNVQSDSLRSVPDTATRTSSKVWSPPPDSCHPRRSWSLVSFLLLRGTTAYSLPIPRRFEQV